MKDNVAQVNRVTELLAHRRHDDLEQQQLLKGFPFILYSIYHNM